LLLDGSGALFKISLCCSKGSEGGFEDKAPMFPTVACMEPF
jgi:hypothetical protein